jgi:hypothetical protein
MIDTNDVRDVSSRFSSVSYMYNDHLLCVHLNLCLWSTALARCHMSKIRCGVESLPPWGICGDHLWGWPRVSTMYPVFYFYYTSD